ncbi:MAG TPA: ribbon-helix-helix protein, CopG family [Vicinamibacteria bacterium]|nr:ribbon-helix-helix protein, CopG family [Vicinamibacteria bacterium]
MTATKVKISVTVAPDLLRGIDREATTEGSSRSAVVERLLRRGVQGERLKQLETATAEYYDSLSDRQRADDEDFARASAAAARRLNPDQPIEGAGRPRSRRVG